MQGTWLRLQPAGPARPQVRLRLNGADAVAWDLIAPTRYELLWLGDEGFHRSHRAALLRKDPEWYKPRFPDAPDDPDGLWPTRAPAPTAE